MGKTISISLALIIITSSIFSQQAEDYWVSQYTNNNIPLHDISFYGVNNGCAAGSWGQIVLTEHGGVDWSHKQLDVSMNFYSVGYVAESKIYLAGDFGKILFSSDNGENWTEQDANLEDNATLREIFFIDSLQGWAVGNRNSIIKTTNGGQEWESLNSGMYLNPWQSEVQFVSVCFSNPNKGWIVGGKGTILRTEDGGDTWELIDLGITTWLNKVYFIDELNGWILGSNLLYSTNDGGETWSEVNIPGYSSNLQSISFATNQIGWIGGWQGKLLKTTDKGATWEDVLGLPEGVFEIHFSTGSDGWLIVNGGGIWTYDSDLSTQANFINKFQLYPNPSSDLLNIKHEQNNIGELIEIYNIQGKHILSTKILNSQTVINVTNFEKGMYFVKIGNEKAKFIKN